MGLAKKNPKKVWSLSSGEGLNGRVTKKKEFFCGFPRCLAAQNADKREGVTLYHGQLVNQNTLHA